MREAVARMRAYHPPLEGRTDKLRMDFNENPDRVLAGRAPRASETRLRVDFGLSGARLLCRRKWPGISA